MGFNNLFSGYWQKQILQDADLLRKSKYINSLSNSFCFPMNIKTGFVNQTTNGTQPVNATPQNYTQFTKAFNGYEGIIAQMENAVHIGALIVGDKITVDNYNLPGWGSTNHDPALKSLMDLRKQGGTGWEKNIFTIGSTFYYQASTSKRFTFTQIARVKNNIDNRTVIHTVDAYCFLYNGAVANSDGSFNLSDLIYFKDWTADGYNWTINALYDVILYGFEGYDIKIGDQRVPKEDYIAIVDLTKIGKPLDPYYTKWFSKPEENKGWFKIYVDTMDQNASISNSPGAGYMGDFQQWEFIRRFNCFSTHEFSEPDLFKLYLIPQHSPESTDTDENTFFYINSCTSYYYRDGQQAYSEITFASVNDALTSTGQVIRQTIQMAAPGEGYALPKLIYDKTGKAIDWEINKKYVNDLGVKTIQVECLGPAAISNLVIWGRPIEKDGQNTRVYASRPLLLEHLKFPISDNLTQQSNPENNFFYSFVWADIQSYYADWKESRKAEYTESIKKTFDGWIMTQTTDDKANGGKLDNWKNSNKNGSYIKDINWYPNANGNTAQIQKMDMRSNGMIAWVDKDGKVLSLRDAANFDYSNSNNSPTAFLNHGSFTNVVYNTMPVDNTQEIPWSLDQIPLIGGFLSKITLGIPIGWRQVDKNESLTYPNFVGIGTFVSASLVNWYCQSFWSGGSAGSDRIPFDAFKTGTDDEVGGLLNTSAMTTAIIGNISDKCSIYYSKSSDGYTWESPMPCTATTSYIGSSMIGNEYYQWKWTDNSTVVAAETTPNYYDVVGNGKYIIDAVGFTGIYAGPVRISAFYLDPDTTYDPFTTFIWQITLKSKAMYTGNIRDIQTIFKTSYLDDFIEDNVTFNWPPPMDQPVPTVNIKTITQNIKVNLNSENFLKTQFIAEASKATIQVTPGSERLKIGPLDGFELGQYNFSYHNGKFPLIDFKKYGLNSITMVEKFYNKITIKDNNTEYIYRKWFWVDQEGGTNIIPRDGNEARGVSFVETTTTIKDIIDEQNHMGWKCIYSPDNRIDFNEHNKTPQLGHMFEGRLLLDKSDLILYLSYKIEETGWVQKFTQFEFGSDRIYTGGHAVSPQMQIDVDLTVYIE